MLNDSILGKIYIYWQYSKVYAILQSIYHFFSNAYKESATRKVLLMGEGVYQWFQTCVVSRIVDFFCNLILKLLRMIGKPFSKSFENSLVVNLAKGSIFLKYEFIVLAVVAVMFMDPHRFWSNAFGVAFAFGLFFLQFILVAAGKEKFVYPREFGLPFALFVLACVLGYFPSDDHSDSIRTLLFFASSFIFMWIMVSFINSKHRLLRTLQVVFAVTLFMSLFAIVQRILGVEVNSVYTDQSLFSSLPGRVYSTVENPNNFAEVLVLFTPLSAAFASRIKNNTWRFICCVSLAFPMLAMLMTYCRSGWMSIALTVLVYVYLTNKRILPWIFILGIMCIPVLPDTIITRLLGIFNTEDGSASFRFELWEFSIAMLKDKNYWLTGIGVGSSTFITHLANYANTWIQSGGVHSQMLYIELFTQTGLLGALSFAWFFIRNIKLSFVQIYKNIDKDIKGALIACVSSFIGISILCIFEYIWFYPRVMYAYFILFGIMIACIKLSKGDAING